jgi:hypothetical protein
MAVTKMQDFLERFTTRSYNPRAEDRHLLLKVLESLAESNAYPAHLRSVFDSLVDASGDAKDPDLSPESRWFS